MRQTKMVMKGRAWLGLMSLALAVVLAGGCGGKVNGAQGGGQGAGTDHGAASDQQAAQDLTPQEMRRLGEKLFAERCASCHGADGQSGSAARLVGSELQKKYTSKQEMMNSLQHGNAKTGMPACAAGTGPTQVEALADYVFSLGG